MADFEVLQGFFPTVHQCLDEKQFSLAEQEVFYIDDSTKRIQNKYLLHRDAVSYEGKRLRAKEDKFIISDYLSYSQGHKYLFINEKISWQVAWAKSQGENVTWFIKDPKKFKALQNINIQKVTQFILHNYEIHHFPSCVSSNGSYDYVTEVDLTNRSQHLDS